MKFGNGGGRLTCRISPVETRCGRACGSLAKTGGAHHAADHDRQPTLVSGDGHIVFQHRIDIGTTAQVKSVFARTSSAFESLEQMLVRIIILTVDLDFSLHTQTFRCYRVTVLRTVGSVPAPATAD